MSKKDIKKLLEEFKKEKISICLGSDLKPEIKTRTNIFLFDYLLGGGIGEQHRIELWGKEGSGKTFFALLAIKAFQKQDKTCIFIDAERSFDKEWAKTVGVDVDNLIILYPDSLEQAGDLISKLIMKKVDLIVIDSIISLIPRAEIERDTDEPTMALNAKINALICKKIYSAYTDSNTSIIFINQLREQIGKYGNPETTSGGKALRHLYNTRIEFKTGKPLVLKTEGEEGEKKEEVRVGHEISIRCNKNKKGKAYRTGIIDFYYDGYLDNKKSLFYNAMRYGIIIQGGGGNYTFGEAKFKGKKELYEQMTDEQWVKVEEELWKNVR